MRKYDFPVWDVRRFLEPGPVVLVSSAWKGERDIMTMGWHMVAEFTPARLVCLISEANHSHGLIRKSRECVINLPTADMIDTVVGIGNCSGSEVDKFKAFDLTAAAAAKVKAPLIRECHANFECRLEEYIPRYGLFVLRVVKAHAARTPKHPKTLHYMGEGEFMVSGKIVSRRRLFRPEML